ncbi:MAG: class II aldolase/adducin family protein [Spirochaetes bacterium]|nr:class II aldolase/adducin family protein [Spirochaetota bacterium]
MPTTQEQITAVMQRIYNNGMTTLSGGNISIRNDDGSTWITPSGVDKGTLRPEDIVLINTDGSTQGLHRPSSEYPFHLAVYAARPEIRAVVHAHPPALVAFSISRTIPDTRIMPKARDICGPVGYSAYAIPGSTALADNIGRRFAEGYNLVLMENHGIVSAGHTVQEAFERMETLDFCARLTIRGNQLGNVRLLTDQQIDNARQNQTGELPEFDHSTIDAKERSLRRDMCVFIHRSCTRQLATSTEGTFSARLDENSFLITPYGVDRAMMGENDLVCIKDGTRERGKNPSHSVLLHRMIYERHSDINAIIMAHPPCVLAFGVTGIPYDTKTIPETYIMLRNIPLLPFGSQFIDREKTAGLISSKTPVVICENDCVIVTGKNILEAFDRLEVAEYSAQAIVNAGLVGGVKHIAEHDIAAINRTFNIS